MLKEYAWGGVGFGSSAFAEVYPLYAYAGIEAAPHSHNLYMQIILSMGIAGLICLLFIMLFYAQRSFEYIKNPFDQRKCCTFFFFFLINSWYRAALHDK